MIHMSGDASILDGELRPAGIFLNEVQGFMSPEDQEAVREQALDVITAYRDGGCVLPAPPSETTVHRMMQFMVAGEIPTEYIPMMLEELELDGIDTRDLHWVDSVRPADKDAFPVVIIGGGMSGILAAIRLGTANIPYTLIEKNHGGGGTWHENRYPGCRVDVGNHFYCYSFEPHNEWSEFFSRHDELRRYFEGCIAKYGIADQTRFGTEVTAAVWDEATFRWTVTVRNPDGSTDELTASAVISATGQLNRPRLPDIPGRDTFEGPSMHSGRWVDGTEIEGKRVAVVGTGASAFQLVPTIAPDADHVDVFQRSAQWMFPNPNYHETVGDGVRWALKHLPYYGRWYRFLLFWPACDGGMPAMRIDPEWPAPDRAVSAENDAAREMFTQYMADQIGDDSELLEHVVPDYVCLGKRTLQDNGSWLQALTRPDVELVVDPIAEITADRLIGESGDEYPADVIVYATGFHANRYLWPMEITGRDGISLSDQWGDDPMAYLGVTVPNFPNLFIMYGPGTNLASGGSMIFHAECQMTYIMGCLGELLVGGHSAMEIRQEVHDDYNDRLQDELDLMVWSHPSIRHSWYRNDSGKIRILSPWRLVDYWTWTKAPDPDEYVFTE